jgi:hypothetical protein
MSEKFPDNLLVSLKELATRSSLRAEVNFLRLPVFALSTKGLRTLNGLEVKGVFGRDGEQHEYCFRTARSVDTLYPGPLARAAHLALLSLGTERLPVPHPLVWTWRELCRRIGCCPSGTMIGKLKEALVATASLTIRSRSAIYSKPLKRYLTESEGVFHLYDRVVFRGGLLPDGTKADLNHLWLADWYRENLDALYAAPLDHELWRWLDARSPIASRAYEFLLVNFYASPVVRINYPTLAGFLPVRVARYYSQAQQQLDPALALLVESGLVDTVIWTRAKHGDPQLLIERGRRLERPVPAQAQTQAQAQVQAQAQAPILQVGCEPGHKDEFTARWLPVWETLPEAEKAEIRTRTRARYPFLRLVSQGTVDALCLDELARDRSGPG